MWRFKPFMQKEHNGLEGRTIDVENVKVHVRNAIAEGGFSCVYLARDALHASKQYALKHIICNDEESLELVMKEISVMKSLKGHPNIVTLHAHTFMDMGRTKEALLVMEFCEKSLVTVLEGRGAAYFDEKQVLTIFRDVCNAVFAMHCQSPPVAHRDLKAENILLGSDGQWKLCDFGSTSINHKRFEKPEEMGIEEDNIRKHTTPAYRAPEMWDLFRRELINEKVDIWALGCLLFRICYFKSAFDGESKLQILNGNYRIPELPKYSPFVTDLIHDMLQASPDARPDITQVWFRVNEQLPVEKQKSLPDRPPEIQSTDVLEGITKSVKNASPVPRRSPPPPPSTTESTKTSQVSKGGGSGGQLGAFWSTLHAKDSVLAEDSSSPKFDEEPLSHRTSKYDISHPESHPSRSTYPMKVPNTQSHPTRKTVQGQSHHRPDGHTKDFEINLSQKDSESGADRLKESNGSPATFQDEAFNTFVAEFDTNKLESGFSTSKSDREEALEIEVEKMKEKLKQTNLEKAGMTAKYEKLSAICRSQRQEIQELKQALAARTPSSKRDAMVSQTLSGTESSLSSTPKSSEAVWELHQGKLDNNSGSPASEPWQAFTGEPKLQQPLSRESKSKSVRTRNDQQKKQGAQASSNYQAWDFGTESFTATGTGTGTGDTQVPNTTSKGSFSQRFGESKIVEGKTGSQPAGWAGF